MCRRATCPERLLYLLAHLLLATDVAVHQRQVLAPIQEGAKGVYHEAAVAGGQALRLGNSLGQPLVLHPAAVLVIDAAGEQQAAQPARGHIPLTTLRFTSSGFELLWMQSALLMHFNCGKDAAHAYFPLRVRCA